MGVTEETDRRESIKQNSRSFFVNLVRHIGEKLSRDDEEDGEDSGEDK